MRSRRPRRRTTTRRIVAWMLLTLAAAVAAAVLLRQAMLLAQVWRYVDHPPAATAFMETRLAALRERDPAARLAHRWVPYERISPWLKRAVIAAEDQRFVMHGGFDWAALREAFAENLEADGVVRGGSTITQQLAKNLFLSGHRSYVRKAQEAAITVMLEQSMDKRRILELYLNVIEWGEGVFGAEAAARHYFGVSAADLDPWQAALLAARIPNPRYYDANGATAYLRERALWIQSWIRRVRVP